MSSDLELVDSVTSYLQEVLALAFCDFRRDLMWKSLTEEMKLNSNICAGDDSHHSHCNNGLHFNSSVAYMNEILEYSAVEDIRVSFVTLNIPPSLFVPAAKAELKLDTPFKVIFYLG